MCAYNVCPGINVCICVNMCACMHGVYTRVHTYTPLNRNIFVQTRRNDAIKTCISSEKEHEIVEKSVDIKYSFLIDKLRSEIQKNTLSSCVQSMELIADPHCTAIINIKGTEVSVKQAKSEISSFIKDNVTTYSYEPDNFFARPILRSPEMLQLSKKIQNELSVSLTIKLQPKVLSSALDESGVIVQVCEGDITLENSDIFINFTDENLTLSDDLLDMLDEAGMKKYERYLQNDTPQSSGTAIYFGRAKDKTVVHAVLPEWIDGKSGEGHLITYALVNALNMAAYFRAVSISLPFLSCIDENIPPDVFVESCLSGVQQFLKSTDLVQVIRLVLPVTMTKKFEEKFNHGVFEQFVMTDELNIAGTNRFFNLERPEDSAWLWEDDDGIYNYYQPEHNRLLNKAVKFVSSCSLKIGPIKYRVDYRDMTQVNTRTSKKRKVVRLPLGFIWQFKEPKGKWEQFSPQVTLMIEAMYSTNTNHSLIINDCLYAFDFTYMTQWNMDTKQKASIRRIDRKKSACNPTRSTVTISGLTEDIHKADIMVKQRIESLKTVQFIDVLRRLIPTFETCKEHIQDKYNVIIARESNVTMLPVVKYKIEGYNECIQKASIEIYKSMATTQKPIEWEPQSKPIILIDILKRSPEWSKVCARMRMTLKCNVLSIKRIQNEFLWEKYVQHKELMAHKGSQSTTEMELFHGTSNNHPKCIYESEEGFDMRYSREGLWGQGNYFAENADYASSFAFTAGRRYKCNNESIDIFQLFLVKVLVGHSCKIHQDNTLRMPPFKPDRKFRYDTVTGFLYGSNIYITYSNDKAYPFYLISYTLKA